jgi:ribosomal protein S6--L-glutamate ligase
MVVVDHTACDLVMSEGKPNIIHDGKLLQPPEAIIPRIGSSVTLQGAAVIEQFELIGTATVARSEALLRARDKLRSFQRLQQHRIPLPKTISLGQVPVMDVLLQNLGGLPVVIKQLESTHGAGVILAETYGQLISTVEAFQRLRVRILLQEFVREAAGEDIRAIVVGGKVVASMRRVAQPGEFRSNLHRGASAQPEALSKAEEALVVRAVAVMGLDVAGVDLLRSSRGPLVLEVNASPGLEGIENTTGVDVAGHIIRLAERKVRAGSASSAMDE